MAKSYAPIQHPIAELISSKVSNVTKPWVSWFKGVQDTLQATELYGVTALYAPTAGFNYQLPNFTGIVILTPATALATGTITLPASPKDKQQIQVASTQDILSITIAVVTGQVVLNAPLSISSRTRQGFSFIFVAANSTWYRLY